MVNEAALLLAEAVANRPADIDVVLINGYAFPRWQGGQLYWPMARGARRSSAAWRAFGLPRDPGSEWEICPSFSRFDGKRPEDSTSGVRS